jgi:hypothetical protein
MRESVRSKGRFYGEMADQVEPFENAGGPAVAKTARFLSKAMELAFQNKLTRQQHAMMEWAVSVCDLETAVALVRQAGISGEPLLEAQSRVWASEIALSVPTRLVKIFSAANALDPAQLAEFIAAADLPAAAALQAGRMADMDLIAKTITA